MNNKLSYLIVAVLAVTGGFLVARQWLPSGSSEQATVAEPAQPAARAPVTTLPEFSLQNRAGELQSSHSWPGKSLVVNFWATWCAPCRREIPLLNQLATEHAADGVQVVGIAVDFPRRRARSTPNHADQLSDADRRAGRPRRGVDAFGIEAVGFPFTVFTDPRGEIVTAHHRRTARREAASFWPRSSR
ncbi:MAG: TlpA disulfide reductase family protein [Paludibacter sp.]